MFKDDLRSGWQFSILHINNPNLKRFGLFGATALPRKSADVAQSLSQIRIPSQRSPLNPKPYIDPKCGLGVWGLRV